MKEIKYKTYLKELFEPFLVDKKSFLIQVFFKIFNLVLSFWVIELIRKLILSVEQNKGFDITIKYGIYSFILLIIILFHIYF